MITAVFFDLFGVIVADGFDASYRALGGDPRADHDFISNTMHAYNHGYISAEESTALYAEKLGITPDKFRSVVLGAEDRDPGVLAWILELRAHPYRTGLISNIGRGTLRRRFSQEELDKYFDVVVASGEIGIAKPSPDIFKYAADQLGLEPAECVMIDDREDYCDGAHMAGMEFITYRDLEQARGELAALLN